MNDLPEGWAIETLSGIAEWASGGTPKSTEPRFYGGGIPWLIIGDLNDGLVTKSAKSITEEGLRNSSAKYVEPGSILVAMYGSIGKLGIAGIRCTTNQAIAFTTRISDAVDSDYLYYYLLGSRLELLDLGKGGAQANISQTVLKEFPIPVAPKDEQRRIIGKIEVLLVQVRSAHERLAKIAPILRRFRQAVLSAACEGRLTADWRRKNGIDLKSWREVTVNDILAEPLANGRSVPDAHKGFPVLRLTCLKNGGIDLSERKTGAWSAEEAKRFRVVKGDFLVARGNGSLSLVGRGGLIEVDPDAVAYPDTLIRIRLNLKEVVPRFFATVWAARPMRDQIETTARTTAGIWKISQGDIEKFILALPLADEQNEIARRVDSLLAVADRIEHRYIKARAFVDGLTQSILVKAFRGELVPTEAELAKAEGRSFETAEELLNRVSAANNNGANPPRRQRRERVGS